MILLSLTSSLSHLHNISVILASINVQMDAKCGLSSLYLKMCAIFSINTTKSGYQGNKVRSRPSVPRSNKKPGKLETGPRGLKKPGCVGIFSMTQVVNAITRLAFSAQVVRMKY